MRKLLLLLILTLAVPAAAFCQNWQFGMKTGLSFASETSNDPEIISTSTATTYFFSIIAEKPLRNNFYFQTALGLTGKGVVTYQNAQTSTTKLTYLDVPLNILYKFDLPTVGKLYVGAGPYISAGLSGNVQFENTNNSTGVAVVFGNTEDYKRFDIGANATAGFELNNHLTFNINYEFGINNIAATDSDNGATNIKNRVFSIGLGFLF